MKIEIRSERLSKVCVQCEKVNACVRPSDLKRKCYQRWYNQNKRDRQAEKLRLAYYRATNFAKSMCSRVKSQSRKSGLEFSLTPAWFQQELNKQVCAATELPFELPTYMPGARGKRGPWTPSVDRIDNKKGYTPENCQLVVWIYNLAKSDYPGSAVARLALALAGKNIKERFAGQNIAIRHFAEGLHEGAINMP